jgi:hypothetical protein
MVAGRSGDDAVFQRIFRHGGHEIHGATDLESTGTLQVLALEPERQSQALAEMVGMDEFGLPDPLFQAVGSLMDQGMIEGIVCHYGRSLTEHRRPVNSAFGRATQFLGEFLPGWQKPRPGRMAVAPPNCFANPASRVILFRIKNSIINRAYQS